MKALVSGSTGFVGTSLVTFLENEGHTVIRLVRTPQEAGEACVRWDPGTGAIDEAGLGDVTVAVHLSGENIAQGRWTTAKKARILDSRVASTRLLSEALAHLTPRPDVLVCASAVGYYGDRGDEWLDENSPPGEGFLTEVCRAWETATAPAAEAGIRVVHARFGPIWGAHGGALAKMLPAFKLGLGGIIGTGRQYLSWIALEDAVGAIGHILDEQSLRGPVNVVAPEPVTNRVLTKALGEMLGRPTLLRVPGFAVRLILGEMTDGLLLASQRVRPRKLLDTGYCFRFPDAAGALRAILAPAP